MITYKRGSYFGYMLKAADAGNALADFTGAQVRCKIKTLAGALVHDFGALDLAADGTALLEVQPAESMKWPAGVLQTDLVYVDAQGRSFATQTVSVQVQKEVTGVA